MLKFMSNYSISVVGYDSIEATEARKLVKVIEDAGIDISHRCGGNARCTTCRVKFSSPEPAMGDDEKNCLEEDGVLGEFRLSCQIRVDQDMSVEVLMPVSSQTWDNPGGDVEE
jgi:ferredoxin